MIRGSKIGEIYMSDDGGFVIFDRYMVDVMLSDGYRGNAALRHIIRELKDLQSKVQRIQHLRVDFSHPYCKKLGSFIGPKGLYVFWAILKACEEHGGECTMSKQEIADRACVGLRAAEKELSKLLQMAVVGKREGLCGKANIYSINHGWFEERETAQGKEVLQ